MNQVSELSELIESEFDQTTMDLVKQHRDLGLRASGAYERSLESRVTEQGENIHAVIMGAEHVIYMEEGRRPNKRQDRGMIAFIYIKLLDWMKVKGVTDINPWMAARKIVREGIKVPNKYNKGGVISGVINEKWMDELNDKIFAIQNESFMDTITSDLQSIAT
jgi:hypothetical protein